MTLDTGHPMVCIDGKMGDADEFFREWLQRTLQLPSDMAENPSGSEHFVVSKDLIHFAFYWNDYESELFISASGVVKNDGTDDYFEIVAPDQHINQISEAQFDSNF